MKNKETIICDIDGVILHGPYWDDVEDFYCNVSSCFSIDWAVDLINGMYEKGYNIIFLTARNIRCKHVTLWFLRQLFDFNINLYMRPRYDNREDYVFKREFTLEIMKNCNIAFAIDDNINNCNMYKELGIPVLHVI